ncbi:MAG: hypothetical protein AAF674_04130 [Pseudomonadota bacterium]
MRILSNALLVLCAISILASCSRTRERTDLLNSQGPSFTVPYGNDYLSALNVMRSVVHGAETGTTTFLPKAPNTLPEQAKIQNPSEARTLLFAYVDARCDAYLDAIFWANRTRGGLNRGNDAANSAATTILAATGAATNVIGIVSAAFGLSGALVDNYYESVLYGLEPSSVRHLVSQGQAAVRAKFSANTPANEAQLLQQVQDYIRQCTPAHLDFMVNAALQETSITTLRPKDQPILLFHRGTDGKTYRLRADGNVLDDDGNVISFGTGLKDIGLEIKCDGTVIRNGGNPVNYKAQGIADWEDACKKARGDGAPEAVATATADPLAAAFSVPKTQ